MEKLKKRYDVVVKTLDTLETAITKLHDPKNKENYESFRDSLVQRFEYSIDNFWKFLKIYLQERHEMMTAASPKAILRDAFVANIISKEESDALIDCVKDRNLTSHTYNELLAEDIASKIPKYHDLMKKIIERIKLS